ncbi:MAG TPA: hypothetical protein VGE47_04455 [Burkholderiaceae bacterium]
MSSLGRPLSLYFPLQLNANEALTLDCVRTELRMGETAVPAAQLRVALESDGAGSALALRVYSTVPVNEPVVTVGLSLGCPPGPMRQYAAFVDPPSTRPDTPIGPLPVAELMAPGTPAATGAATRVGQAMPDYRSPPSAGPTSPTTGVVSAPASRPAPPPPRPVVAKAEPKKSAGNQGARERKASQPAALAEPAPPIAVQHRPRLRLDPADVLLAAPTPAAVAAAEAAEAAEAASAAAALLAAASAPDPALERLRRLEEQVDQIRVEHKSNERNLLTLRGLFALEKEQRYQNPVIYSLSLAVLFLSFVCYYLWRARERERAERQRRWMDEVEDASHRRPPSSRAFASSSFAPSSLSALDQPEVEEMPAAVPVPISLPPVQAVPMLDQMIEPPPPSPVSPIAPREPKRPPVLTAPFGQRPVAGESLGVEALIDLEQQIEFFMALGQGGAAIELLTVDYGAAAGPWPQLLLLEVYQREQAAGDFEILARSYATQFGLEVPRAELPLADGAGLADRPELIAMLQAIWSDCGATMDLLQGLLVHGGHWQGCEISIASQHLYTLPMLRDLLMLYSVARDTSEHEVDGEGDVDVFLPLENSRTTPGATSMLATMIWKQAPPGDGIPILDLELDLDLDPEPADSTR